MELHGSARVTGGSLRSRNEPLWNVGSTFARARALAPTVGAILVWVRERNRLRDEFGLTESNLQMETTTDAIIAAEGHFHDYDDETPNIVAARLMMGLCTIASMTPSQAGTVTAAPWQWLWLP
jgi:hypothetical protein